MSANLQNKKKLTVGIAAVAAAAITLGAGTYAFFSATGEATDTNATAGTLELGQSSTAVIDLGGFVPGGPRQSRTLTYTNNGSVTADLTFATTVADTENGCNGDESRHDADCGTSAIGDLSGKLKVKITRAGTTAALYDNLVSGLPAADLNTSGVTAGTGVEYTFEYYLPNGVDASDNAVQGDSVKVTTTATLRQP